MMDLRAEKRDADWDVPPECDGCGEVIEEGEVYLSGIRACSSESDCERFLCQGCVAKAFRMIAEKLDEETRDKKDSD